MMSLSEFLEKWGCNLFEAPLAVPPKQDEPPELAEIRLEMLGQIRLKAYRAGGKRVFPFDCMRVHVRGVESSRAAIFQGNFFRQYLEQELRNALRQAECRFPEALRVEVETTPVLPAPGQPWMTIETTPQAPESAAPAATGRLVVVAGRANVSEIALTKSRTNIGRTTSVYRSEGLLRRNDLTFEEDNDINRTVSREHAHVSFDRIRGEYRLHNDRWYPLGERGGDCATFLVRDGMSEAVHRDTRGARLESGDEIHLGSAVIRFETC
jgi:hypothetical protein